MNAADCSQMDPCKAWGGGDTWVAHKLMGNNVDKSKHHRSSEKELLLSWWEEERLIVPLDCQQIWGWKAVVFGKIGASRLLCGWYIWWAGCTIILLTQDLGGVFVPATVTQWKWLLNCRAVSVSAQGGQFDRHLTLGFHMGQSSNLVCGADSLLLSERILLLPSKY